MRDEFDGVITDSFYVLVLQVVYGGISTGSTGSSYFRHAGIADLIGTKNAACGRDAEADTHPCVQVEVLQFRRARTARETASLFLPSTHAKHVLRISALLNECFVQEPMVRTK
jgi:hypothetical protein